MLDQVKKSSLIQKSFHFLFAVSLILTGCEIPNQNSLSSITGSTSTSGDPINSNNVGATGTQLLITGGNNQTLGTNTPALRDLEIFAVDSKGVAMSGVDVTFEITQNFGKFTNNSNIIVATTGTNGRATIGFSSLTQIGAATVVATSTAGSAVFNFSVGASVSSGATGSILLAANGNNQIVAPSAAATRNLEVIALDNEGSPMNGVNVNFTILTSGAGSLTGGGTTATATTGTNGRANIGFTASAQTGAVSIVAASAVGSTVFTLQVNASANNNSTGSMLLVSNGNNQTVIQGNDAGKSLEVMAVNSLGLPISGVSVKFEVVTSGAGTLTGGATTYTATTNGSGKASVDFTASSQIGAATILATSASGSAVFNLSVTTGSNENTSGSSLLIVNGNGQNVIQSQAASKNLEVMALNSAGVPISGIVVTYEVITAGSGTLTGGLTTATATTAANGRASIGFTASSTLGTASVVARSSAGNAVFAINVVSSSNNTNSNSMLLVTSGNNQSVLPGQAAGKSLEVLALNSIGTPITGLTVNFEVVTSGAGTLSSATATTNANGRATVNFTASSQLGAATVVATSTAGSAVFYLQVSPSSNTGSTGSILLVTNGNNQTVVKNSAAEKDLEVLALDNLGAPIPNITITFQVATSGSGTLTGGTATATATTDANGKAIMGYEW